MTINKIDIDLGKYRGNRSTIFTGRPQGEEVRRKLELNRYDQMADAEVVFKIPGDTTSFNPSFYLGLLYDSYKNLRDNFLQRYSFEIESDEEDTKRILQKNLDDAHKSALNALHKKNPFAYFM